MAFRPEDLRDLDNAIEVRIETRRDANSVRSTVIWILVDNGEVFVRSVNGTGGRWYRDAIASSTVTIDDGGRRLEARAVPVTDAATVARVDEALRRKYTSSTSGLPPMLTAGAQAATFRLDPRAAGEVPLEGPAYLGDAEPSELGPAVDVSMLDAGPAIEERVALQPRKSV